MHPRPCQQILFGRILTAALETARGLSGDCADAKESRSLTQLRSFAEHEGEGPEFGDGGAVEVVIAHRAPEAGSSDHVQHVEPGAQGSDDAAEQRQLSPTGQFIPTRGRTPRRGVSDSPEDGQRERPQRQRPPQVQLRSLPHEVLTGEDEGGVQAAEHKRLVAAKDKKRNNALKCTEGYICSSEHTL